MIKKGEHMIKSISIIGGYGKDGRADLYPKIKIKMGA